MWLYLLIMLLFIFLSCKNGKSKIKLYLSGFILFVIMGFKDISVGNDTPNYVDFFNRINKLPTMIDPNNRFEKGYQLYNKLLGFITHNYQILFIVTALICISCIMYGIKNNSRNWMYSLFLFIGLRFFYFFLSGLRQSLSVSIVFVAYIFLKRNKLLQYLIAVALAMSFHFSAFIFIFALPLSYMKINKKNIIKIVIATLLVYILFNPLFKISLSILPNYYSLYLGTQATSTNNFADIIGVIIPIVFLVFAYNIGFIKNQEYDKQRLGDCQSSIDNSYNSAHTEIYFLIISAGLSLIATKASILNRMIQYYWIFSICSISNIVFSIRNKKTRTIWFFVISLFVIAYNLIILIYRPEWNIVVPYRFFWY